MPPARRRAAGMCAGSGNNGSTQDRSLLRAWRRMKSGDFPGLQNQWLGDPERWVRFPSASATFASGEAAQELRVIVSAFRGSPSTGSRGRSHVAPHIAYAAHRASRRERDPERDGQGYPPVADRGAGGGLSRARRRQRRRPGSGARQALKASAQTQREAGSRIRVGNDIGVVILPEVPASDLPAW